MTLEELETATAETLLERKEACLEGTATGLPMGLAFDDFDDMTQTLHQRLEHYITLWR